MGFALLKGKNWKYLMSNTFIIIGRSKSKNEGKEENVNKIWYLDIDFGASPNISHQHALIAYNFEKKVFEIKNLSSKYPLYVNGCAYYIYDEARMIKSKDLISIGSYSFFFLLPI